MKNLYDLIDTYYPYHFEPDREAESNLLVFQLPEYDWIDFSFAIDADADGEIINIEAREVVDTSFLFGSMVNWSVVVELFFSDFDGLWESLVKLNQLKHSAMLVQQLLASKFKAETPAFKQLIVYLPDSPAAREFIEAYKYWVSVAEDFSEWSDDLINGDTPVMKAVGESQLTLAYDILHRFCFSGIQFIPEWDSESYTYGPFTSFYTDSNVPTSDLFKGLIENQYGASYIDRPLKIISEFISEELRMNITETAQQGGCWNPSCPAGWLKRSR